MEKLMSQEAVERLLGRLLTDDHFRKRAGESIVCVSREAGYDLNEDELNSISHDDVVRIDMVAGYLDGRIKRFSKINIASNS